MQAQSSTIGTDLRGRLTSETPTTSGWFAVGDCLALMVNTAVASWMMLAVHERVSNEAVAVISGMVVSMLASTIVAAVFGAVLGSIETKVPAMVAGMLWPMSICAWSLTARAHPSVGVCTTIGAAAGLGLWLTLIAYGRRCRVNFSEGRWRC